MTTKEYLQQIDDVIANGKYKDNWESLSNHKTPDWYHNGKLGIFIHWGIYSVPAYGSEWYSRAMYDKNCREFEYHRETYGTQDKFGYKDFIPMFKAEKFNADKWAALFKESGAKSLCPCVSIMTDLLCMIQHLTAGMPKQWDLAEILRAR